MFTLDQAREKYPKDVGAPGPEVKLAGGAGTATATDANGAAEKKSKKKDD